MSLMQTNYILCEACHDISLRGAANVACNPPSPNYLPVSEPTLAGDCFVVLHQLHMRDGCFGTAPTEVLNDMHWCIIKPTSAVRILPSRPPPLHTHAHPHPHTLLYSADVRPRCSLWLYAYLDVRGLTF